MYSKNRIGNRNVDSKLPIVVSQINSISSIKQKNLGKPGIDRQSI